MKVMLTGAKGQLGHELTVSAPSGIEVYPYDVATLDITQCDAVQACVRSLGPDVIVNAAAYTNVDGAEKERNLAFAVNADGPGFLAEAAECIGARFVQVSTDYVFDGRNHRPWRPDDPTSPINVYGESKLEGERRVRAVLGNDALVLRTAWLYSAHGHNFMRTMLRLMRERDSVSVVDDQIGTPTHAAGLAGAIWHFVADDLPGGIHHWTDAGVASWYDFAVAIRDEALAAGLLDRRTEVLPIPSSAFPTPATRPAYSILDKSSVWALLGSPAPHWREALAGCIVSSLTDMARAAP